MEEGRGGKINGVKVAMEGRRRGQWRNPREDAEGGGG